MKLVLGTALAAFALGGSAVLAQPAAPAAPQPFAAGLPLGVTTDGKRTVMSSNVKVYGAYNFAESCSYDADRGLILAVNRGANNNEIMNDGFVSAINHDGTVHTAKWIGETRNGLTLNSPLGSDVGLGKLYVADRDGGENANSPAISVVRMFDLKTGAPAGEVVVRDSTGFNDLAIAKDGTVYASQTGGPGVPQRIYKITPGGASSVFVEGAPLNLPNGVAMDGDGNIVVVNIGSTAVLTFSPDGKLLKTENAVQPGNDGLVIMRDGTKYVSSVRQGGVSRIRPGQPATLIASGIPAAASMCYDAGANQLVIPMNPNNAMAFIKLN